MQTNWRHGLIYLSASLCAGLFMISSESLWIDEGQTLHFANLPTLGAWFHELLHNGKSEAQMPLGMFVGWLGGKLIGLGEWEFRATNLLWVTLGGLAVGLTSRLLKCPVLLLLFLLSPFLWFYTNEARPYAMQICAGAWFLYVLARIHTYGVLAASDVWLLGLWALIGFGASLLFGSAFIALFAAALWLRRHGKLRSGWTARHWIPMASCAILLGVLSIYYLYTLKRGAGGARLWKVTPLNLAFWLYETLGFSGLGPPRNELRNSYGPRSNFCATCSSLRRFLGSAPYLFSTSS